jgi:hypothetical protein
MPLSYPTGGKLNIEFQLIVSARSAAGSSNKWNLPHVGGWVAACSFLPRLNQIAFSEPTGEDNELRLWLFL